MSVLTGFLFFIFGQYRTGSTNGYSAVFADASRLKSGDSVRVAGVRVGTVDDVALRRRQPVLVTFDADRDVVADHRHQGRGALPQPGRRPLSSNWSTGPGSTRMLPAGAQIPMDRTAPALDLDLLLGGLKPVIQGLNPQDVNALTASLIQVFQGQGDTLRLAAVQDVVVHQRRWPTTSQVIEQLIDNLNAVVGTFAKDGDKFSGAIDRLQQLISRAGRRTATRSATAIDATGQRHRIDRRSADPGPAAAGAAPWTNSAGWHRCSTSDKDAASTVALQKAPENYRKLARLGVVRQLGSTSTSAALPIRVTDLQGRTAVFPWFKQEGGRCAEP